MKNRYLQSFAQGEELIDRLTREHPGNQDFSISVIRYLGLKSIGADIEPEHEEAVLAYLAHCLNGTGPRIQANKQKRKTYWASMDAGTQLISGVGKRGATLTDVASKFGYADPEALRKQLERNGISKLRLRATAVPSSTTATDDDHVLVIGATDNGGSSTDEK